MSENNFEIPEHLLKRSAEAKAEALGLPGTQQNEITLSPQRLQ